ncbi:hypothetical protein TWF225_008997 [Orbilia oligospora]|uniref:Uncharacterized protein n=1 Tax=Orbilia oligospora TaxID=2813651 RepID=A0A8H2HNZ8_ORBOL|nr:hypothetical protein TWF225_008997 [Orbilia oligospora]KAF3240326.1 hypothetical protein TWF128_011347 [Orbilia oligospora]KAF3281767.1 hypothetical protein TWF132_011178 [Orbilia oligospora]TGJ68670.1 hypothetical protein EYR41_004763 [Orbilia oligospora]
MSNENEADAAPVTPIPHFCVLRLSMPMYRHACIQDRSSIDFPSQGLSTRTTQMAPPQNSRPRWMSRKFGLGGDASSSQHMIGRRHTRPALGTR